MNSSSTVLWACNALFLDVLCTLLACRSRANLSHVVVAPFASQRQNLALARALSSPHTFTTVDGCESLSLLPAELVPMQPRALRLEQLLPGVTGGAGVRGVAGVAGAAGCCPSLSTLAVVAAEPGAEDRSAAASIASMTPPSAVGHVTPPSAVGHFARCANCSTLAATTRLSAPGCFAR